MLIQIDNEFFQSDGMASLHLDRRTSGLSLAVRYVSSVQQRNFSGAEAQRLWDLGTTLPPYWYRAGDRLINTQALDYAQYTSRDRSASGMARMALRYRNGYRDNLDGLEAEQLFTLLSLLSDHRLDNPDVLND